MVTLIRTLIFVALFVGLALVILPARALGWSGLTRPEAIGIAQYAGWAISGVAGALAIWCVLIFAIMGRGTPLPFAPPQRLVTLGPYAHVRNPMALGVGIVLVGAALVYQSRSLLGFAVLFFVIIHLFVVLYEEPTLRETFGGDYEEYCRRVRRWWPGSAGAGSDDCDDSRIGAGL